MKSKDYGLTVYANENSDINELLRRFRKRVEKAKVLDIYKEHQVYVKPSLKKHLKKNGQKTY
jgi:ribosomal protein S21